jgi:antitoxin MazE
MKAKIAKWGNSLGIRVPRAVADAAGLKVGQMVDLAAVEGGVTLRVIEPKPRYSLAEMVAEMRRLGPASRPRLEVWGILPSEWPQEDWSDIAPTDEEMGITGARRRRPPARRR